MSNAIKRIFFFFQLETYATAIYRIFGQCDRDDEAFYDHLVSYLSGKNNEFKRILKCQLGRVYHSYVKYGYNIDTCRIIAKGGARLIRRQLIPWEVSCTLLENKHLWDLDIAQ